MSDSLKWSIHCVSTGRGWRYRVSLWAGRVEYRGLRDYARHQDAERAARATGAISLDDATSPPPAHPVAQWLDADTLEVTVTKETQ